MILHDHFAIYNYNKHNLNQIVDNFISSRVLDRGISSNTITAYKKDLNLFITWCEKNNVSVIKLKKKGLYYWMALNCTKKRCTD